MEYNSLFCFLAVLKAFRGDLCRTIDFFKLPNPNLGGLSPYILISTGKKQEVQDFIKSRVLEGVEHVEKEA